MYNMQQMAFNMLQSQSLCLRCSIHLCASVRYFLNFTLLPLVEFPLRFDFKFIGLEFGTAALCDAMLWAGDVPSAALRSSQIKHYLQRASRFGLAWCCSLLNRALLGSRNPPSLDLKKFAGQLVTCLSVGRVGSSQPCLTYFVLSLCSSCRFFAGGQGPY